MHELSKEKERLQVLISSLILHAVVEFYLSCCPVALRPELSTYTYGPFYSPVKLRIREFDEQFKGPSCMTRIEGYTSVNIAPNL